MQLAVYFAAAIILLLASYFVFRRVVRRVYLQKGQLTPGASFLQLAIFAALMSFPILYNPPEWFEFWRLDGPSGSSLMITGFVLIILGFGLAFGTMFWFGIGRAFGIQVEGLVRSGPYRFSRNPQILGGYLLVLGSAIQWLSGYSIGWLGLYGVICHLMILTEEEHLNNKFGEAYQHYCEEVPRYILNLGAQET